MQKTKTMLSPSWLCCSLNRWIMATMLCVGALSCATDGSNGEDPFEGDDPLAERQAADAEVKESPTALDASDEDQGVLERDSESAELTTGETPLPEGDLEKTLASLSSNERTADAPPSDERSEDPAVPTEEAAATPPKIDPVKLDPVKKDLARPLEPDAVETEKPLRSRPDAPLASYMVLPGDSLTKIAQKIYGSPKFWQEIAQANALQDPYIIYPGDGLKYPLVNDQALHFADLSRKNMKTITVQRGDSLSKIAAQIFGSQDSWRKLFHLNKDKLRDPNVLPAGITLAYANETSAPAAAEVPAVSTPKPAPETRQKPAPQARTKPPGAREETPQKLKAKGLKPKLNVRPADLDTP